MPKSEREFRDYNVLPFLKTLRNTAHFPIQQLSILGDADFILCSSGFFVWLELKKDGEELRRLQEYKASWVKQTGGIALVARPDNWDMVRAFLKLLDGGIYDKTFLRSIEQDRIPKRSDEAVLAPDEDSGGFQA